MAYHQIMYVIVYNRDKIELILHIQQSTAYDVAIEW